MNVLLISISEIESTNNEAIMYGDDSINEK